MLLNLKKLYWDFSARHVQRKMLSTARQKKDILGTHASAILYETKNGIISMPIDDMTIGEHMAKNGDWDYSEIEIIQSYLKKEYHLYVVGTHVGTLLVPLAQKCAVVVGYEANPSTFRYLNHNILLNQIDNAKVYNLAAGDRNGRIKFLQNKINSGGSKIKPITIRKDYISDHPDEIEVEMINIKEHIEQENLPKPDAMIMDIEGSEYFALKGMGEYVDHLKFLYTEFVPHHLKNISGVDQKTFFDLITPHFNEVQFVRKSVSFSLNDEIEGFLSLIDQMFSRDEHDDLLFLK